MFFFGFSSEADRGILLLMLLFLQHGCAYLQFLRYRELVDIPDKQVCYEDREGYSFGIASEITYKDGQQSAYDSVDQPSRRRNGDVA